MPDSDNPNHIELYPIKESIRWDNHLPVGKFWKLRDDSSGFGEILEPSQDFFSSVPEIEGR
jgi:hypothetical protein